MTDKLFKKDMTTSEVIELVGIDTWEKMLKLMAGQTGEIRGGKFYMYDYDLEKAYRMVSDDS